MDMKRIKLGNFEIGGDKLTILTGPCALESKAIAEEDAAALKEVWQKLDIKYCFKSTFDKANRSSITS